MDNDYALALLPQHVALLQASAISTEVAQARDYQSINSRAELGRFGFSESQRSTPGLLLPVHGVIGELTTYQYRPDHPRIDARGKAVKYETRIGSRMVIDVSPIARRRLADPGPPLFITEGIRKADAAVSRGLCCIALLGVWNWRGTNEHNGRTALSDWEVIALNERTVYIVFDSDVMTKPEIHHALARLKGFLELRGAHVNLIYLPPGQGATKVGLDDYLASGNTVAQLLSLASPSLRTLSEQLEIPPYKVEDRGLVWQRQTQNGVASVLLTNFVATIVGDVLEEDGADERRSFEIEAEVSGQSQRFEVPADRFAGMSWVSERLGPAAVVYPGLGLKDHSRAAIQLLSDDIRQRRIFAHTGWRLLDGRWVYLHGGGATGVEGPVPSIEVSLPDELGRYSLPEPPKDATKAIRASLDLLEVGPATVTVPLHSSIWRSILGDADCALHIEGPTGAGKTALCSLVQQHFGAGMSARNLPGSWASTANALERLAFLAKDAVLVVDDFAPTGTASDVQRLHREADRLLRGQGNRSGRGRMTIDGTLRPVRPPRGLIVSTGEDVPRGQSLRARLLVIEIEREASKGIDWAKLTECQSMATQGLYSQAVAGFVRWLAGRYSQVRADLRNEVEGMRQYAEAATHRRTTDIIAQLAVGMRYFLIYALEAEALQEEEARALWRRCWHALTAVGRSQAEQQLSSDAVTRWLALLTASIAGGRAHVVDVEGLAPTDARAWGWRAMSGSRDWQPQGELVAWLSEDDLYLEPETSLAVVQRFGRDQGDTIPLNSKTLHKRMSAAGLLASTDTTRGTLTIRKTLAGRRRSVLHLKASTFMPRATDHSDQTDHAGQSETSDEPTAGQVHVSLAPPLRPESDHEAELSGPRPGTEETAGRQIGQSGQVHEAEHHNDEAMSGVGREPTTSGNGQLWEWEPSVK